ncbi:MAG: TonB-dependent receptor plug domain-containing protein [Cyanobacteria bacterium P01_E01_bin.6]
MMKRPCGAALFLLSSVALFSLQPAAAEELANPPTEELMTTFRSFIPALQPDIFSLDEIEQPATTVNEWLMQMAQAELVEITAIALEETTNGFMLRLETTGELVPPETTITGNAAIADIPNAVLNLSNGDDFFASDPVGGIALIDVSSLPDNRVRIAVTGTDAPPAVTITSEVTGITVSAIPGDPTAQVSDDETIQVVVTGEQEGYLAPGASTATRTDTPLRDVPQAIQVIPREVIEDQQAIGVEEVLENAAGVSFLGGQGFGLNFAVRGFDNAPILRDGFRQFGLEGFEPEVANLEQVEVLRGPASVLFGESNPGG